MTMSTSDAPTFDPSAYSDNPPGFERFKWQAHLSVLKFEGEVTPEMFASGEAVPYEVVEVDGNMLLNAGIQRILDKLIGAAGQVLDNTHARIGVGNSTTAAAASQTDLQAASGSGNRQFKLMDATFPSRSSQTLTFQATFGTTIGNFAWNEWGIDAGTADGTTVTAPLLNRKVESMGTKTSANTWIAVATATLT